MNGPQAAWLPDGRRLHLNHGPIDLIVETFGEPQEKRLAYAQAMKRFETVLSELVDELTELRKPANELPRRFKGSTANRMERAVCRHAPAFITPMAAVAGSVADEIMAALTRGRTLEKAYVNNGGDSALYISDGQSMTAAIAGTRHGLADRILVRASDQVRGIATSGWRGRSHSLGIADAATVLAKTGAEADAAATLIANAVDLPGHPAVIRVPASDIDPDSDLGARLVTWDVGPLSPGEVSDALERGLALADAMRRNGLIVAAALFLGGQSRLCEEMAHQCLAVPQGPSASVHFLASPARKKAHA
jgi:ApbE superfamily uncharacterized protein (UPF0280 family)